jgi:hypothetical protein
LANLDFSHAHGRYLTVVSAGGSVNTSWGNGTGMDRSAGRQGRSLHREAIAACLSTRRENLLSRCYILNNGTTGM